MNELEYPIYYKLYKQDNGKLIIVCLQDFDERDYDKRRFLKSKDGETLKFNTEEEAIQYYKIL
jgi:hypothetical protein